jgi:hypothetical protein
MVVVPGTIGSAGGGGGGINDSGAGSVTVAAGRRPFVKGRARRSALLVESKPVVPAPEAGGFPNAGRAKVGRSPTFERSVPGRVGLRSRRAVSSPSSKPGRSVPAGALVVWPNACALPSAARIAPTATDTTKRVGRQRHTCDILEALGRAPYG